MHKLLVPDLPMSANLLPWLERIDTNRQYSNFGPLVVELEVAFGAWLSQISDTRVGCVTVNTGTAGLELALSALELPAGSRVLVPALTFPASALAVVRAGHIPVFADVDAESWQLTPSLASEMACDAVMPVATYGLAQAVSEWDQFSRSTGCPVVIDAASAMGYQAVGEQVIVVFSLHATKPFGCGEGGLVASRDSGLLDRVKRLSNFGFHAWRSELPGTNAKLSEYAAAVGLAQLERRSYILSQRQRLWDSYLEALGGLHGIRLQADGHGNPRSVMCLDVGENAQAVQGMLAQSGIETRRWYCPPLYEHPALARYADEMPLPITQKLSARLLGVPFHNFLSNDDIRFIVAQLKSVLNHG
jgi:dTDP-4-amino-4,6-dideoxygalactose transaminase